MRSAGATSRRSRSEKRSIPKGRRPARTADCAAARTLAPTISTSIESPRWDQKHESPTDADASVGLARIGGSVDRFDLGSDHHLLAVLLGDLAGGLHLLATLTEQ